MPETRLPRTAPKTRTIAILGGGASGALVATQLLRKHNGPPLLIHLIERRPFFAQGTAYSTPSMHHLLNVPAAKMSAFPDQPDHFLKWLETNQEQFPSLKITPGSFIPRKIYGSYLQAVLQEAETQAQKTKGDPSPPLSLDNTSRLEKWNDEATSLEVLSEGVKLQLKSGQFILADQVVLALGNFPPGNPFVPSAPATPTSQDTTFYQNSRYISDPWSPQTFENLPSHAPVLLIGTGLTMADLVISLKQLGHTGKIHVLSRHGFLPQVHKTISPYPSFLEEANSPQMALDLFRLVRKQTQMAMNQGIDWRSVIDSLRPHTQKLWKNLSHSEQKRFLRHLRPFWDIHRHRIAPEIAAILENAQKTGQMVVHSGRIQKYEIYAEGVEVEFLERSTQKHTTLKVNRVLNCTGPDHQYRRSTHPLIIGMLKSGLALPHPCGLGITVSKSGALIQADKTVSSRLYTLGTPQIGALWETTAIPELRVQADALAQELLNPKK